MVDYWSERRIEALDSSRKAPTAELRDMYLRVAEHCSSLEQWCFGPIAAAAGASANSKSI